MEPVEFGIGRGGRIHLVSTKHRQPHGACGVRIDTMIPEKVVPQQIFCHNCQRTKEYKERGINGSN